MNRIPTTEEFEEWADKSIRQKERWLADHAQNWPEHDVADKQRDLWFFIGLKEACRRKKEAGE